MTDFDWLIRGGTVVAGSGLSHADVAIRAGSIVKVEPDLEGSASEVFDARGLFVFPGLMDVHNHPYYEDDIEAFSLSAATGGITTLMSFAGRPWAAGDTPAGLVEMVQGFVAQAEQSSYLDFGVHAILGPTDDPRVVVPELFRGGVRSFKAFMAFPGRRMLSDDQILLLMEEVAAVGGICMVHCENGLAIRHLESRLAGDDPLDWMSYIRSRPPELEAEAVFRALALAALAACDVYIVHASGGSAVEAVRAAPTNANAHRFVETCPHYLLLDENDQARMGAIAEISPPMRTRDSVAALWDAVATGEVDVVGSDASGQSLGGKDTGWDNVFDAPFGIPGVEHMVPLFYDEAVNRRNLPVSLVARLFAERPAAIFGLTRKGAIRAGADADLVVFDPTIRWTIHGQTQQGHSDYSLYEGREIVGKPVFSMQRANVILRDGEVIATPGTGSFLGASP